MSGDWIGFVLVVPMLFWIGLFYIGAVRLLVRGLRGLARSLGGRPSVTAPPVLNDGFPPYQP